MNLQEAREILKDHVVWCDPVKEIDTLDALKLGIEALNLVEWIRQGHIPAPDFRLPGETKDLRKEVEL